jgi:nucleotide-binding universal stress UspA family protein
VEATSGSVPGELLTTTPCALAVVPRRGWTESPAHAPIVVGVDEPAPAHAALAYAYAAASRTGRPLTILHCAPSAAPGVRSVWSRTHLTAGLGGLFPDVAATVEEVVGDRETRLAAATRTAATLVLGARDPFASGRFGSVSRKLIRRGHCPVVIARGRPGVGRVWAAS